MAPQLPASLWELPSQFIISQRTRVRMCRTTLPLLHIRPWPRDSLLLRWTIRGGLCVCRAGVSIRARPQLAPPVYSEWPLCFLSDPCVFRVTIISRHQLVTPVHSAWSSVCVISWWPPCLKGWLLRHVISWWPLCIQTDHLDTSSDADPSAVRMIIIRTCHTCWHLCLRGDRLTIAYIALFSALLSRLTALVCGSAWVTNFL